LAEPVEDKEELFLHLGGRAELVERGGVEKLFQVLLGDLDALELAHALGRGHGVENQVVVRRQVVPATEQVDVGVVVVLDQKGDRNRRRGKKVEGKNQDKPKQKNPHCPRVAGVGFLERCEITRKREGLKGG